MDTDEQHEPFKAALKRDRAELLQKLEERDLTLSSFQTPVAGALILYAATCWGVLGALLWLWSGDAFGSKLVAFLGFGWVGHAMLLVTHEAGHRLLLRNRSANEWFGNLLFALPAGQSVESYRVTHALHHNYLHSKRDIAGYIARPELPLSQVRKELVSLLLGRVVRDLGLRLLTGRRLDPEFESAGSETRVAKAERERLLLLLAMHLPILGVAVWTGWLAAYVAWVLAIVCVTPFLDGVRTILEHRRGASPQRPFHTRSHHRNHALSLLVSPFFQYHWEHHVVPSVPHAQLGRLHRILCESKLEPALPVEGGSLGALRIALREERAQ